MKRSRTIPPEMNVRRRWHVPPALIHGAESLEGGAVLQEISGETGLLLWQALRDVILWANTPAAERNGLFSPEAERKRLAGMLAVDLETAVEAPLGVITTMVGRPARVASEQVALACSEIAQWAEMRGRLATALAFFQAAALACPGDAGSAFKVGQIARKRAEHVRAESWFRRTIALARQAGDWSSYALAFLGLGTLYMQKGNFPVARKFYVRCLRAAKRHSLKDTLGCANHDLLVIAILSGNTDGVEKYARAAFEAYGSLHPRIPRLAHDVAYCWLAQGFFTPALSVFRALLPHISGAGARLVVRANMARAAGGAGEREVFECAWQDVWNCAGEDRGKEAGGEGWAEALVELARGAASLGEWNRAESAARRAHTMAHKRGESRIKLLAETVLESVQHDRIAEWHIRGTSEISVPEQADQLAEEFIQTLRSYAVAS